jgi:hypothetical protein
MITVLLALLVGLLIGALLAHRLFYAAATGTSRRALDQLQGTLDGLESAYSIKVATFEAQRELSTLSALPGERRTAPTVHLPPVSPRRP